MSGKMTKFKDLLVDTPNRYTVNGEVKTIVFAPNAVTQEGTKDKAEYFNEMQKNGLYNVNATRVVEGTVEFYDIAIEGSDIFDVFDTQFLINFNETNTKLNPVLRFNNNNYYIRALKGFIDIDIRIGSLQKTYIGFLDSANNKLKLMNYEIKLTFDTVIDAQAYTEFVEGDRVQLLGFHTKNDGAGHERVWSTTVGIGGISCNGGYLNILNDYNEINILWGGAIGDNITDDLLSINNLLDDLENSMNDSKIKKVFFPKKSFLISGSLIIPSGIEVDFGNSTIHASSDFLNGYILVTKHYDTGKPEFRVYGERCNVTGFSSTALTENLNGIFIDTCNFSTFKGLVFQAIKGYSMVMGASGARDIISFTIENIETNTSKGLLMRTGLNSGTDYGSITNGTFRDCFFSVTGQDANSVEMISNDKSDTSGTSIFGINFERCSLNSTNKTSAKTLSMKAYGKSKIRNIEFINCEGETRRPSTDSNYLIDLYGVESCKFNTNLYFYNGNGIRLENSNFNIFENFRDGNIDTSNTNIFLRITADSNYNTFINVAPILSEIDTSLNPNAPQMCTWFSRIIDSSATTIFMGIVSSNLKRIIATEQFLLFNSTGKLLNPAFSTYESVNTWSEVSGIPRLLSADASGLQITLPNSVPLGSRICIRLRYKFEDTTGVSNWRIGTSYGGTAKNPKLKITTTMTDAVVLDTIDTRIIRIYSTDTQSNVAIQFEKLEVFYESVPYIPRFTGNDIKRIFEENPYGVNSKRPANASQLYVGYKYHNTSLNKPIFYTGSTWIDATGTTV